MPKRARMTLSGPYCVLGLGSAMLPQQENTLLLAKKALERRTGSECLRPYSRTRCVHCLLFGSMAQKDGDSSVQTVKLPRPKSAGVEFERSTKSTIEMAPWGLPGPKSPGWLSTPPQLQVSTWLIEKKKRQKRGFFSSHLELLSSLLSAPRHGVVVARQDKLGNK